MTNFCYYRCGTGAWDIYLEQLPILLNTVTVEGADARLYADRTVYVPNERQKNAAQSGEMLLGLMAIPQLDVDLSMMSVKTSAGQTSMALGYDIENGLCTAKIHKPLYAVKDELFIHSV